MYNFKALIIATMDIVASKWKPIILTCFLCMQVNLQVKKGLLGRVVDLNER